MPFSFSSSETESITWFFGQMFISRFLYPKFGTWKSEITKSWTLSLPHSIFPPRSQFFMSTRSTVQIILVVWHWVFNMFEVMTIFTVFPVLFCCARRFYHFSHDFFSCSSSHIHIFLLVSIYYLTIFSVDLNLCHCLNMVSKLP